MFIIVPFLISVIIKLGYDQKTAFATTIGAILVGMIGYYLWSYIYQLLTLLMIIIRLPIYLDLKDSKLGVNSYILVRFIILAIFTFYLPCLLIRKQSLKKLKKSFL
jgi:hypothetical protein